MIDIQGMNLVSMNNGAHYEFMKVVNDRFASEAALSANAAAKKAIEALAAALKEEDRCLAISRKSLMTEDIRQADSTRDDIYRSLRQHSLVLHKPQFLMWHGQRRRWLCV